MESTKVISVDEFKKLNLPRTKELLHSLGSIRYCKIESYRECLTGTVCVLPKDKNPLSFGIYLNKEILYLISDTGDIRKYKSKLDEDKPDAVLLQLLELLIDDDILYLEHLNKKMEEMEDELLKDSYDNFFEELTQIRKRLSRFHAYYEQLSAMASEMLNKQNMQFISDASSWGNLVGRLSRLESSVMYLRENVVQLREYYHARQADKQNSVMTTLTIVTTIFLPLSLLAGWYGMNFVNMPELRNENGYFILIGVAIVIIILEIIYFKKKKYDWTFYLDVFNNEIVGYDVRETMHGNGILNHKNALNNMLNNKIKRGYKELETIVHTDQGSVYSSMSFNNMFNSYNVTRSMSRAGTPTDNPVIESKNGWIKKEMHIDFDKNNYTTVQEFIDDIVYDNNYYRPSFALNYKTPIEYRTQLGFK